MSIFSLFHKWSTPIGLLLATTAVMRAAQTGGQELLRRLQQALSGHDTGQVQRIQDELVSGKPSLDVLLSAGALLGEHDLLQNSAVVFERCVAMYPESFEAHYNLAFARLTSGQPKQGLAALSAGKAAGPIEEAAAL